MSNSKPIIVIDAGHGGKDSGALGPKGEREKDVALSVALLLGAQLTGIANVIYTRKDDTFPELAERARIANANNAHLFLSIHCNSGEPGKGEGFEVFTTPGETGADRFSTDLFICYSDAFPSLRKRMDMADGDPDKEADFTVLKRTACPAALFELEFIHTTAGAAFLTDPANQLKMAKALAAGVRKHMGATAAEVINAPATPAPLLPMNDVMEDLRRVTKAITDFAFEQTAAVNGIATRLEKGNAA